MARRQGNPAITGGKYPTIRDNREHVYDKLKKRLGKRKAAQIANAGHTGPKRSAMARKGAATRKRRGR